MDTHIEATHYAILIGINDYPDRALQSCVRDVQEVQVLLQNTLEDLVKIWLLTADTHDQKPAIRPTKDNVITALEEVVSLAAPGSYVYIHFSGHGSRATFQVENSYEDVALVLVGDKKSDLVSYY